MFNYCRLRLINDQSIILYNGKPTTMYFQRVISPMDPSVGLYDGYIIVTNTNLWKYKIPTCDVRIVNKFITIDQCPLQKGDATYDYEDGIYEISAKEFGLDMDILRRRHDRVHSSSPKKYELFLAATAHWKEFQSKVRMRFHTVVPL